MKLRTRLGLGIVSITIILLVPLILVVGAAGAILTQVRVIQARAAAEA